MPGVDFQAVRSRQIQREMPIGVSNAVPRVAKTTQGHPVVLGFVTPRKHSPSPSHNP